MRPPRPGRILALAALALALGADTPRIRLDGPLASGRVDRPAVTVAGRVEGLTASRVWLVHDGLRRRLLVSEGRFRADVALFEGDNALALEVATKGGRLRRSLRLDCRPRSAAVAVWLTWAPRGDLDLIVIEPGGRRVSYASPRWPDSRLWGDVMDGQGPELYRSSRLQAGPYRLIVRRAAAADQPALNATLQLVWRDGSARRSRRLALRVDGGAPVSTSVILRPK